MQLRFIAILILLLFPLRFLAAVEPFSERIEGSQITTTGGPHLNVYDSKYVTMATTPTGWQTSFFNKNVVNKVRLGINPDVLQTNALSGNITLKIKTWTWDIPTSSFVTAIVTQTLAVNYSMTPSDVITDAATFTTTGAHRMEITITAIDAAVDVNDVYIQAEIEVERYYTFNSLAPLSPSVAANGEMVNFEWSPVQGAEFYELEWVHVNDYKASNSTAAIAAGDLNYDFYKNSTRVILRTPYYTIPKLFDRGYLLFRVRAIGLTGTSYTMRKEGNWTVPESGLISALTATTNYLYIAGWADQNMNWGHQVSYAEDGKRFEGISFADGLGRPHQSLGHNTETQQVVVSNTYYDGYGRPVLSDLPTPDNNENLVHRPHFNHAEGASFFGPEHFDWNYLQNSPTCAFETKPMDINYGAGKYYSQNNTDQDGENARIPDAKKYPFSRIEYMDDYTGRIRRVGNAGPDFQIGSGHETEFFYAVPSQEELDRLFGSEAGHYEHYQKRITVDANEQMYIEYFDMAGRVVASGLAGQAPANLSALTNNTVLNATQTISEGVKGEVTATSMILTQPLNIVLDNDYTFGYDLNPSQFTAATCMPDVCFDCAYTLIIKISEEECGDTIYGDTLRINGSEYDAICNGTYPFADDFTVHLPKNHYILTKTLTVDQDAINQYWCTYLEQNTCIPTFAELFNDLYSKADFGQCDNVVENDTDDQSCATMKEAMLNDVSPGGQYAGYTVSGAVYTPSSTISVLYTGGSPNLTGNWRNPFGNYLDAQGQIVKITVVPVVGGGYFPAVFSGVVPLQPTPGVFTIEPEQLANLSDFVQRFQDSWANALLKYHPEYCYLEFCEANNATNTYDVTMSSITTFEAAKAGGYFAPKGVVVVNYAVPTTQFTGANNPDPFAVSSTALQNKLANDTVINGLTLSMLEYAIALNTCPDAVTLSCLTGYTAVICNQDAVWLTFRDLYLAAKAQIYAQAEEAYISGQPCAANVNKIGVATPATPFSNCVPRWGFVHDALATNYSLPANNPNTTVATQSASACQTVAAAYVDQWMASLSGCPTITALDSVTKAKLRTDLIAFCSYGCTYQHTACATTLPPVITPATFTLPNGGTLNGGAGINDVLHYYISTSPESEWCTELLISDPGPYKADLSEEVHLDTCGCDLLLATNQEFQAGNLPAGVTTIEQLLAYNTGLEMEDINALICECDKVSGPWTPDYTWQPWQQTFIAGWNRIVPQELTCDDCIQCDAADKAITDLTNRFGIDIAESENYPAIMTNYFNKKFGFDLDYSTYYEFLLKCHADPLHPFCEATDELLAFGATMNLVAHNGKLVTTGVLDLTKNVVYKNSVLKNYLQATEYTAEVSGTSLNMTFSKGGTPIACATTLTLPDGAAFSFGDIVSFGLISATGGSCEEEVNTFQVEVSYYACGELKTATLSGTTDCFPVQICYCGPVTLCNEPVSEQFVNDMPCYEPILSQLYQEAEEAYDQVLLEARKTFEEEYNLACSAAFSTEKIVYTGPVNHYQYTLFYYDQAGNLVKTVAPKGVTILDPTTPAITARETSTIDVPVTFAPVHLFDTKYSYNSYGQLTTTTNPDQDGATNYWYDRYGRIIASQNPVQAVEHKYSYILYDPQGRPIEVGQADLDALVTQVAITSVGIKNDDLGAAFKTWVYNCVRTEVTRTVYDESYSPAIAMKFAGNVQQNLRLRVAAILYYPTVPAAQPPTTGYESATHYSYDVHGNVLEALQDVPSMSPVELDIVSTRYQFELLSGNVKKVEYQKERWDATTSTWKTRRDRMTHEYVYDKLNRLTEVFTSTDNGVHKNREAHYRYFDYGPLSRVEIGQNKVQGNDFTYTLHGWLKAMNGTTLDRQRDGGKDGGSGYLAANSAVNELFAADVTGYTLGYYKGDYKSIGATSFEAAVGTGNAMSNAMRSLYNGNIAYTTMAIDGYETKGGVYVYDQLQRLLGMRIFHSSALQASNTWNGSIETKEYSSSYTYDENGNLKTLVRKGTASIALDMDDFAYKYLYGSNRLTYVSDAAGTTPGYTADLNSGQAGAEGQPITAGQSGNNYQYDKLGQLLKDVQENDTLVWRFGDKKLLRQTSPTRQLEFTYNPMGQRVVKVEKQCVAGVAQAQTAGVSWLYTYYGYDANGQVMTTYSVKNNGTTKEAAIDEQMIYGAGRIGLIQQASTEPIYSTVVTVPAETATWLNRLGKKRYELSNHLGNVNAVITDRKVVNADYAVLSNDSYTSTNPSWSSFASCGAITQTLSGGTMTTTSGNCTLMINRTATASANTTYTFSVDVVNRNDIAGFSIELLAAPVSGTFTLLTPVFTNVQNGKFSYTFTTPAGTTQVRYALKKLSVETGKGFMIDNLYLGTANAQYAAVPVQKMDYYPYGMEMSGGIKRGAVPSGTTGSGSIVEEAVTYTNYYNTFMNTAGDLEVSSASIVNSTDNSANGVQTVLPGEYIEFTASPDPIGSNRTFVGLSYMDGGFLQTSINYAWYLYPDGGNHIYESGANPYNNWTVLYVPGVTKFKIARTGGNIVYSKNGTVIRTVVDANPTAPMVIDITIWNTGSGTPAKVYKLKVGKLQQVVATYASGDYVPYMHSDYRFGYNGMEKDPEIKGDGNAYTTEFRQYDPRLGRWMSLDPLMQQFPWMSPYVAFDDNPVLFTDPYGLKSDVAGPGGPPSIAKLFSSSFEFKDENGNNWLYANGEFTNYGTDERQVTVTATRTSKIEELLTAPIIPVASNFNEKKGQCFTNAPTLGGKPNNSHPLSAPAGYKLVPGTKVETYQRHDGTTLKQASGTYMTIGMSSGKGGMLGLLLLTSFIIYESHQYNVVTTEQIQKITSDRVSDNQNGNNETQSQSNSSSSASSASPPPPDFKKRKPNQSGKESASDIPDWAQGNRPYTTENGKQFARRLLNDKYGEGNWQPGPKSEFNQLQKYADRAFQ